MSKYYQEEIECMEHSKLEELQLERLRDVAVRCYENIPLYKQRFDEAGVDPYHIESLEDIKKFPFTVKQDMRDAYPFGGGLHCSTADVYREGECLDYFPNRVKDPTLVRPEMWND